MAASATGGVLPGLRLMMFGGEAVPVEQVRRFARLTGKRVRLVNHYGPTEASAASAPPPSPPWMALAWKAATCPSASPCPACAPMCWTATCSWRRAAWRASWPSAARAWRPATAMPALTAERFVADPYCGQEHGRMYRSGDLARWNSDGSPYSAGATTRSSCAARIELGEVESALLACDGVQAAVATVLEVAPGDKRLVAYFVGSGLTGAALRAALAARLPDAMLPAIFERLQALPRPATARSTGGPVQPPYAGAARAGGAQHRRAGNRHGTAHALAVWQGNCWAAKA